MLKLSFVSLLMLGSAAVSAQEPAPAPVQTVVQPGAPLRFTGWYLAPTGAFTSLGGTRTYAPGLRGALMLNQRLGVGMAFSFLANDHTRIGDDNARKLGGYGGGYAQYVFRSTDLLHAYVDATVGSGGWCEQSVNDRCNVRHFALFEPTLNAELNLTRNVRLATGVGYRFAFAEKQAPGQSRNDMSGIVARTSLVIGMF
jgi:hypothetical protein